MDNNFLTVNKDYLNYNLKSIDILIIAQIEEFERNKLSCYITNQQFANMFGESERTINRVIKKLEELNIIKKQTIYIKGSGRGNRQRILSINNTKKWKCQNDTSKMETPNCHDQSKMEVPKWQCQNGTTKMDVPNLQNGSAKNAQWKCQNGTIKDNIKENIKYNIYSDLYNDVIESYNNNLDMDYDDWAKEIAIDMECNVEDINAIIDDYITT
nr:MAG TPA: transcriptional regulatory protein [Caudoviricetes sp.]